MGLRLDLPGLARRTFIRAAALGLLFASSAALAAYPEKPVRLLVPFAAGGPTDQLARSFAQRLSKELGQPVIAENRVGGNSVVAIQAVVQSGADGYTLVFAGQGPLVVSPQLSSKIPYDIEKDLVPLGVVANMPLVVLVNPSLPASTLQDFVRHAKANPGKLNYGSPGTGNPLHLAVELFNAGADIKMTHVPFNGTAPALTALMGGELQTVFDVVSSAAPFVSSGRLKALAVTSTRRSALMPNVPTVAESGMPGYEASSWFALAASSKAPAAVHQTLAAATQKVMADAEFTSALEKTGLLPYPPMNAQQIQGFLAEQKARWGDVIRKNNIRLD
ncbi:Bug family tripartite tricarboxylate transporter substrate binding protein [Ramlibacter sp.]|uniref:Bug family tripartite tricarboxylate transporter substrate binding protein n=1 Tax=Ramlibacter sp. TaxID=1917967 RepID=UPI003D0B3013